MTFTKDNVKFELGMKLCRLYEDELELKYYDTKGAEHITTIAGMTFYRLEDKATDIIIEDCFYSPKNVIKDVINKLEEKLNIAHKMLESLT